MDISTFDDLLLAARRQPQAQRLLLVFAGASLPEGASAAQRARFEAGESGELAPLMCVDKDPQALAGFDALAAEAASAGPPWALVFAAAIGGSGPRPPAEAEVTAALERMVESVSSGDLDRFIPFDSQGHAVRLR